MDDQEQQPQEAREQPCPEGGKDEQECGGHVEEKRDVMSAVSEATAELTDLVVPEIRPSAAHVELLVAVVASRADGREHVECLAWVRPVDDAGRKLARTDRLQERLAAQVRERVVDSTAELLTNPFWDGLKHRCHAPDYGGVDEIADKLAAWNHDLLRQCLADAGLPGPLDSAIVFVVPLPGDQMLSVASEAIKVVGITFAVVTGHVAWACASFQSLMHDKLIGKIGKLIEKVTAESVHAAAQAARAPAEATALITEDEPVSVSKPAPDKATPTGGWYSAARRLDENMAAVVGVSPTTAPPAGKAAEDATGPAVGLAAPRSAATSRPDAVNSARDAR